MKDEDEKWKARVDSLEQEVEVLKRALGMFAGGLDRVSKVQAGQTGVIEGLVKASEGQTEAIKRLLQSTDKLTASSDENSILLRRLAGRNDEKK